MIHKPRTFLWLVLTLPVLRIVTTAIWAGEDDKPSGTVSIESTSIAVGVGVHSGDGMLTLNDDQRHRFSMQGLQVGSVGVSKVSAEGKVYHLPKVADFEGTYVAGEASIAVGGGPGVIAMRNPHGVVIQLESVQHDVKFTIAAQGVEIRLKQ